MASHLLLHHNQPTQRPHYCWRSPDPSVHLSLQLTITCEQDPHILRLLHLRQRLITDSEGALHLLQITNHGLGFGRADVHPGCFTLGCELLQSSWRSWLAEANKTTSSAKAEVQPWGSQTRRPPLHNLIYTLINSIQEQFTFIHSNLLFIGLNLHSWTSW